eukprot:COSAG05_NODE_8617_length_687_cov_1.059524_1_plen_81_part_00
MTRSELTVISPISQQARDCMLAKSASSSPEQVQVEQGGLLAQQESLLLEEMWREAEGRQLPSRASAHGQQRPAAVRDPTT